MSRSRPSDSDATTQFQYTGRWRTQRPQFYTGEQESSVAVGQSTPLEQGARTEPDIITAPAVPISVSVPPLVIDASNLMWHSVRIRSCRAARAEALLEHLGQRYLVPRVLLIADAATRFRVEDRDVYERLLAKGLLHESPGGTRADDMILVHAYHSKSYIVTNDRFRDLEQDRPEEYRWYKSHCVRFSLLDDIWTFFPALERLSP